MGQIKRQTMKFVIPTTAASLLSAGVQDRKIIEVYLNPTNMTISENKIIPSQQTVGGFMVQYWGEALATLKVNGTTGSGGIEAVHILRDVYRNEQIQFRNIILNRMKELSEQANSSTADSSSVTAIDGIQAALTLLTGIDTEAIEEGVKSTIELYQDIFSDKISQTSSNFRLNPSLGAFAVSIDIYFQGETYRGFFENFNVTEAAESSGLFNYDFSFKVLKRSGRRKNFMPWHRNPRGEDGVPRPASTPMSKTNENLSFPFTEVSLNNSNVTRTTGDFLPNQTGTRQPGQTDLVRFNKIKSNK